MEGFFAVAAGACVAAAESGRRFGKMRRRCQQSSCLSQVASVVLRCERVAAGNICAMMIVAIAVRVRCESMMCEALLWPRSPCLVACS